MELVDTLFASLSGTDPFTGVDITIANCKSTYWMKALFSNSLTRSWMKGKSSPVLPVLRDYLDMMSH